MSRFIDLVETFEISAMTAETYLDKINGLLERFPKLKGDDRYRIVLPQKYPKTADDYVSIKFCVIGRLPVYGIYHKRNLQLIAVCVEGTLFAIDDCDLDPNLVPDLSFEKVNLGIRHSSLAVSESLSYTKSAMCSAVSTLSLGYTSEKKNEWTDAVVLLMGMTTQAVRFSNMLYHIKQGIYQKDDYPNVPHASILSIQNNWRKVSKAIREGKLPYRFEYYNLAGKIRVGQVDGYSADGNPVQLIDDGDRTKRMKVRRRNDDSDGQREGSKTKSNYEENTGQVAPALGASQKLDIENTGSLEICGISESAYLGLSGVLGRTLAASALGARQKFNVENFKSIESCETSESAYSGTLNVLRRTLAAAAFGATQKVSASMKDLCFDQFGRSKEEIDPKMVNGDQESGELLQLGFEPISDAFVTNCVYRSEDIMTRMEAQHSNTNAPHSSVSDVFRRTLPREGLKGFQKGLFPNLLKVVSSARASTKLKAAIAVVAKGLLNKK